MSLDATIPTQATRGDELAEIHRETRAAVNVNALGIAQGNMPGMTHEAMIPGQTSFDVGGSFVTNITLPGAGVTLLSLSGGYDGQLVILRIDEAEVQNLTINHLTGAITLQDEVDWAMNPGDMLWLINDGGVPPAIPGGWYEANRSLYKAVLGLVDTNGLRYKLVIDAFGALNVEILI